jgi:serine phosphatase RsbU (regulator of sigma subunit)
VNEKDLLQDALQEKLFSAEKRISILRLVLVLFNTLIYLLCYEPDEYAWLAYTVIVVANIYSATSLVFEPYRKLQFLSSIYYTSVTDGALIVFWIIATGMMGSPFFVIWYVSLMAVAFRYSVKETAITSILYVVLYLGIFQLDQEVDISMTQLLVRLGYIPLAGMLGMFFSIEISEHIDGKIKIIQADQALKKAHNELERKVEERTEQLVTINKDLTDSINYAERIQLAILPSKDDLQRVFQDSFVFHLPKDIISGDFHWMHNSGDMVHVAVVDCTGHGVPGALLSMIGSNLLNSIVIDKGITEPSKILSSMDSALSELLKAEIDGLAVNDGMDMSVCAIDRKNGKLVYAGAQGHGVLLRNGEVICLEPTKYSIGGLVVEHKKEFLEYSMNFSDNDSLYLFTDGFQDQFGGVKGKKFYRKNLLKLIDSARGLPMTEQLITLRETFTTWKGKHWQVDDVTVLGLRLKKG